jgi:predicted amidophosphoribosyltransferase
MKPSSPRTCPVCGAPFPENRPTCPSCRAEAAVAFTDRPEVVRADQARGRRAVVVAAVVYGLALALAWLVGR